MASVICTDEDKQRVLDLLRNHSWFKIETGFQFVWDNSPSVVIGWGGWRDTKCRGSVSLDGNSVAIYDIEFKKATLVTAYLYKGEWHLSDIERMIEDSEGNGRGEAVLTPSLVPK